MKAHCSLSLRLWQIISMSVLLIVLAGCATPQVDWESRVGHYNFDQAATELGPPDKVAPLSDGTKVADWLTHRGSRSSFTTFGGGYHYGGPWIHQYVEPPSPDHFLRLTFGPDGVLKSWRRVVK